MLKRSQALEIIRNSTPLNPFHIVFYNQEGNRLELNNACLASNVHKTPRHIKNADKKFRSQKTESPINPNDLSNRYDTFNIYNIENQQIRKANIEFVTFFNHQKVVL